jgi:hypothetical protein
VAACLQSSTIQQQQNNDKFRITSFATERNTTHTGIYRVTRIKQNPCFGWEILKSKGKQMTDICFLSLLTL